MQMDKNVEIVQWLLCINLDNQMVKQALEVWLSTVQEK